MSDPKEMIPTTGIEEPLEKRMVDHGSEHLAVRLGLGVAAEVAV